MQVLTDAASDQVARAARAFGSGLLGVTVVLSLAVVAYGHVGWLLADTAVVTAIQEWLWTDRTLAYFLMSVLAVLLVYVESNLDETADETDAAADESEEQSELKGVRGNLFNTFREMVAVNTVAVVALSGVVAGVVVAGTPAASFSVAAAVVYPVAEVRVLQKTGWFPTPVGIGIVLAVPLAAIPTLYTVPFHIGTAVSKRFASFAAGGTGRLLSLVNRVTDAVPGSSRLPTRRAPRRRP